MDPATQKDLRCASVRLARPSNENNFAFLAANRPVCKEPQASALMPNTETGPNLLTRRQNWQKELLQKHISEVFSFFFNERKPICGRTDRPVFFKSYKIKTYQRLRDECNKPKAAFRCGSCTPLLLGRRKSEEKNLLKHFKYCPNQGWITAGVALVEKKRKKKD